MAKPNHGRNSAVERSPSVPPRKRRKEAGKREFKAPILAEARTTANIRSRQAKNCHAPVSRYNRARDHEHQCARTDHRSRPYREELLARSFPLPRVILLPRLARCARALQATRHRHSLGGAAAVSHDDRFHFRLQPRCETALRWPPLSRHGLRRDVAVA